MRSQALVSCWVLVWACTFVHVLLANPTAAARFGVVRVLAEGVPEGASPPPEASPSTQGTHTAHVQHINTAMDGCAASIAKLQALE
jgi:hypothetical protein